MKVTPRRSKQIVSKFVRGGDPIRGNTLTDVAKTLRRDHRGGSVQIMTSLLQKRLKGGKLYEYKVEGQTFYGSYAQACKHLKVPQGTRRAVVVNSLRSGAPIQVQVAA